MHGQKAFIKFGYEQQRLWLELGGNAEVTGRGSCGGAVGSGGALETAQL